MFLGFIVRYDTYLDILTFFQKLCINARNIMIFYTKCLDIDTVRLLLIISGGHIVNKWVKESITTP